MKTLYIECNMGAAGDMLTAALIELLPDPEAFLETMNAAGIPGLRMTRSDKVSCGIRGTHISVAIHGEEEISQDVHDHDHGCHAHDHHHHEHDHHHAGIADVRAIINGLRLPDAVKRDTLEVYQLIAEAESGAHGCSADEAHFHEVGMLDAVTDVSAVCLLMHLLKPDRIVVSPLCTGYGRVRCAHGIVPVPAPATAHLLRGMPAYAGRIEGELLTPTGAALIRHFAQEFGYMPPMAVEAVGCGMGMKEFEAANCVRVFLGEAGAGADEVFELSCNLDDMTGEAIGFAMEQLMAEGALDAYLTPIQMKKGRPGVKLSCLCRPADRGRMEDMMLRHTATLGVRAQRFERRTLERCEERVRTPYGEIGVKVSRGSDFVRRKPEYEDAANAARAHGVPLAEVLKAAEGEIQ